MSSAVLKVTKRRGYQENYNEEKIRDAVAYACEGLEVDVETLFSLFDATLYDGIPTSEIQANLIHHAKTLCSPFTPDWTIVAGRLETMNRWADTRSYDIPFADFVREQIAMGIWRHEAFSLYSDEDLETIGTYVVRDRDLNHSYASVIVASQKYILPGECIQHMFIGNAMIIASVEKKSRRLEEIKEIYDDLSLRELSSATPWLSNLRSGGNISSCFIIDMTDDINSIFTNMHYAALISKAGGGLGVHLGRLRARGSDLMGSSGRAGGIIGWNKIYSDIAAFVNQGGKRAGAFTMALPIWHSDIEEFLLCQTEHGDLRTKAFGIQPQVGVHDLFMELKGSRGDGNKNVWHTFCPHEVETKLGLKIYEAWGEEFRDIYAKCVEAKKNGILKVSHTYQAKELWKLVMKRQFETGLPYIAYLDAINEANPNKHEGYIPCVNLCVAPETQILTDRGYITIGENEGKEVNVWNGEEFSSAVIKKTGENQKLLKVTTKFGNVLECTPYHKFYVQNDYRSESVMKRAAELVPGDKLIKSDLPVIEGNKVLEKAYTNGFYSGDGSNTPNGSARVYLYHEKRNLRQFIEHDGNWYVDEEQNREYTTGPIDLREKFFVPDASYTIASRLKWLAGWLDADGVVCRNETNHSIQGCSTDVDFLKRVQFMLHTLGVASKIAKMRYADEYPLPLNDGSGENGLYPCSDVWRILISSIALYKLSLIGFKSNRLEWTHREPQRNAERFDVVESVADEGRISDTYCFNEPKRHMGFFAGILTGNCTESFSVVVPNKYAHTCNLMSLVVGRLGIEGLERAAARCTRILDNGIELTKSPNPYSEAHNNLYRTIGIGIQGLHDLLAREYKSYDDTDFIAEVAERIAYGAIIESIELAKERGAFPAFRGSDWDNGKMIARFKKHSVVGYDWDRVQQLINCYGIRNSQLFSPAPNTSSSIFMDAGAGVMPVYNAFFYEDNMQGALPVAAMHLKDNPLSYSRDVTKFKPWDLPKVVGALQKFIDTGISAEYIMNKNEDDFNVNYLWDTLENAWKERNKAVYYIRTIKRGEALVKGAESCSGCAG